jgi:hypothetical protein
MDGSLITSLLISLSNVLQLSSAWVSSLSLLYDIYLSLLEPKLMYYSSSYKNTFFNAIKNNDNSGPVKAHNILVFSTL